MNRCTLVTGVSSGIGRAIATLLLQEGHEILGISRLREGSDFPNQSNLHSRTLDLSKLELLKEELPELANEFPHVSSIVFCAGYGKFGNLEQLSFDQIEHLVNTNFLSHVFLARAFLPNMKKRGKGNLVFIGSESTLSGGRRGAVYVASKSGFTGLAKSLRRECASGGIHVGLVIPGMVRSEFYDQAEFTYGDAPENFVEPEDIARTVSLMLNSRTGTVFDEVVMTPLKSVIRRKSSE